MKKLLIIFIFINAFAEAQETPEWRPNFHFSPQKNWVNDPNGLVYYRGEYHLFFQHNPYENKWGHMSWGHAVSKDLLHWEELPVAIPEDSVYIFSGCVVVDKNNSSGLAKNGGDCLVAIYTADYHGKKENQQLAYSNDAGRTWQKYAKNPILSAPLGSVNGALRKETKDFRDPNVFWHEKSQQWIMTTVLPTEFKVQFYGSKNLISWQLLSEFGQQGDVRKIWECPSLIELPIDKSATKTKWVLIVSSNGIQENFVGMQYFVGNFDGKTFKNDNPSDTKLYVDAGKDFYAAIPFSNAPNNRKIMLGWMLSWNYAEQQPTFPWKGQMALPREIELKEFPEGLRLVQQPPKEYLAGDFKEIVIFDHLFIKEKQKVEGDFSGKAIDMVLELEDKGAKNFGIKVLENPLSTQFTFIGYDFDRQQLWLDRSKSGKIVAKDFSLIDTVKLPLTITANQRKVKLHILLDRSSVEVFGNDGKVTLTDLVFPESGSGGISFLSEGGTVSITGKIAEYNFNELKKIGE